MNVARTRNILTAVALASTTCLLAFYASNTLADDSQQFGVGVSTNANAIYFPMRLNNSLMVEPMYYYYNNENGYQDGNGFYEQNKTVVLGVGIFSLNPMGDDSKVETYWGMRVGFLSVSDALSDYTFADEYGVIYEPTLGLQYFFTPRFSISANASLIFQRGSIDMTENGQPYLPYDHNFSGSLAKVIVRGYFN